METTQNNTKAKGGPLDASSALFQLPLVASCCENLILCCCVVVLFCPCVYLPLLSESACCTSVCVLCVEYDTSTYRIVYFLKRKVFAMEEWQSDLGHHQQSTWRHLDRLHGVSVGVRAYAFVSSSFSTSLSLNLSLSTSLDLSRPLSTSPSLYLSG